MNKINIVIPMAGAGSRFKVAGYDVPKPFIDINSKMMIEHALNGLLLKDAKYTLIIQEKFKEENASHLEKIKKNFNVDFIAVEKLTAGACCTALAAHKFINNNHPVVFADSDNIFDDGILKNFIEDAQKRDLDGSLVTFQTNKDCFSFAQTNEDGFVTKTAEKQPISNNAIAGIYYFKKGSDFVEQAINMMIYNDKQKGEFYMSAVYNWLLKANKNIGIYNISNNSWSCVGTPEQLNTFNKQKN